eukprot:4989181-Pleurochrysis_carterae.AAC.3
MGGIKRAALREQGSSASLVQPGLVGGGNSRRELGRRAMGRIKGGASGAEAPVVPGAYPNLSGRDAALRPESHSPLPLGRFAALTFRCVPRRRPRAGVGFCRPRQIAPPSRSRRRRAQRGRCPGGLAPADHSLQLAHAGEQ